MRRQTLLALPLMAVAALAGCRAMGIGSKPIAYAPAADGTIGLVGTTFGQGLAADERKAGIDAEFKALICTDPPELAQRLVKAAGSHKPHDDIAALVFPVDG